MWAYDMLTHERGSTLWVSTAFFILNIDSFIFIVICSNYSCISVCRPAMRDNIFLFWVKILIFGGDRAFWRLKNIQKL